MFLVLAAEAPHRRTSMLLLASCSRQQPPSREVAYAGADGVLSTLDGHHLIVPWKHRCHSHAVALGTPI
jgi:hypothetical protein